MSAYHERAIEEDIEIRRAYRIRQIKKAACHVLIDRVCWCWEMMGVVWYANKLERLVLPLMPDVDAVHRALLAKYAELTDPDLTTV